MIWQLVKTSFFFSKLRDASEIDFANNCVSNFKADDIINNCLQSLSSGGDLFDKKKMYEQAHIHWHTVGAFGDAQSNAH